MRIVQYRAVDAHDRAWYRARRPKPYLLDRNEVLGRFVADMLAEDWSPQQISGFVAVMHPPGSEPRVSHETICRTLFIQSRGALKRELTRHLLTRRPIRKHKYHTVKGQLRSQIAGAVSIHERPPDIEDRAVPGHWEGISSWAEVSPNSPRSSSERHGSPWSSSSTAGVAASPEYCPRRSPWSSAAFAACHDVWQQNQEDVNAKLKDDPDRVALAAEVRRQCSDLATLLEDP